MMGLLRIICSIASIRAPSFWLTKRMTPMASAT
jgi:hypothetical protein